MNRVIDALRLLSPCYAKGDVLDSELYMATPIKIEFNVFNPTFFNKQIEIKFYDNG